MVCGEANCADPDAYIQRLTKYICDKRICLEVCLTSNMGTMPELAMADHAVKQMFEHGVSVTLNTGGYHTVLEIPCRWLYFWP